MSIGDVAASLEQIRAELLRRRDRLRATAEQLTSLIRLLSGLLGRSGHPLMLESLGRADEALSRVIDAVQELALAAEAVGEYRAAITGAGSNGIGHETRSQDVSTAAGGSMPSWIDDAAAGLAERAGGKGPTTGIAFDGQGEVLFDGPISSGRGIARTSDLRPVTPSGKGWPWTFTDHVESAVAARMREPRGPRDVTLLLNNTPCTDDPYGCDRMLPHLIPVGSRVSVYVKTEDPAQPVRLHSRYEGTGRLIKS